MASDGEHEPRDRDDLVATVVIPTRDRPAALAAALAAISTQTIASALEVVVVDDGSQDEERIDELLRSQPRARLIRIGGFGPFGGPKRRCGARTSRAAALHRRRLPAGAGLGRAAHGSAPGGCGRRRRRHGQRCSGESCRRSLSAGRQLAGRPPGLRFATRLLRSVQQSGLSRRRAPARFRSRPASIAPGARIETGARDSSARASGSSTSRRRSFATFRASASRRSGGSRSGTAAGPIGFDFSAGKAHRWSGRASTCELLRAGARRGARVGLLVAVAQLATAVGFGLEAGARARRRG